MIYFKINYDINDSEAFEIDTNAKVELIPELLGEYIRAIVGAGADHSEPNNRDIYNITLYLDLSDDSWQEESNTGNKGLTAGIIMNIIKQLQV